MVIHTTRANCNLNQTTQPVAYRYRPLKAHDTIRLIKLQPLAGGPQSAPLDCRIVHVRRSKRSTRFDAISYTWGEPDFSAELNCGGTNEVIKITPNLASALRRFRFPNRPRRLWVDAVCINQSDDAEKSQQVSMMGQIYSKAAEVLVWVGDAVEDTSVSMDFLKEVAQVSAQLEPGSAIDYLWPDASHLSNSSMRDVVEKLRHKYFKVDCGQEWAGLGPSLLEKPWFGRRWVIQEVALAKVATVYSGEFRIKWLDLALAISIIYKVCPDWYSYFDSFYWLLNIWSAIFLNGQAQDLFQILDLMSDSNHFDCSNDRDRVYALLGIINRKIFTIKPRYQCSVAEVYTDFARQWLLSCQRGVHKPLWHWDTGLNLAVTILDKAGSPCPPYFDPIKGLPSWVPDWRPIQRHKPLSPASRAGMSMASAFRFNDDWRLLTVSGISVDVVQETGGAACPCVHAAVIEDNILIQRYNRAPATQYSCHNVWSSVLHTLDQGKPYHTGETLSDAFARTLVADTEMEKNQTPSILYDMYTAWSQLYIMGLQKNLQKDLGFDVSYQGQDNYRYAVLIESVMAGRRFFTTANGYMGIGPFQLEPGDMICILGGARAPCVLRPRRGDEEKFQFMGPCYVHGIMNGELCQGEGFTPREFVLV